MELLVEREPVSQAAQSLDLRLLSVVIVNFNGMDSLPATLESLSRQLPDMSAVIVSDDGSPDESREWVSRHYTTCRVVGPLTAQADLCWERCASLERGYSLPSM
jgi:hypothetical protein